MNLAERSAVSISWNIVAQAVTIATSLVLNVLLARWLPVEVFGVYAFGSAVISLTIAFPNFGMAGAFVHHAPETEDEDQAAGVHFTLKWIFTSIWALFMLLGALVFSDGQRQTVLIMLTVAAYGVQLAQTPQLILTRRVTHKRLALVQMADAILSAFIALALAWQGVTLWALVSTKFVTLIVMIVGFYVWRPVWRPRLTWRPSIVRYFLGFGSRVLGSSLLMMALDQVDDLWAGVYLGDTALGFYSRAYSFATYPRSVLARPVNNVASGTYANLKGQREQLSRAFSVINTLLLRSSFLLGGVLVLVAPEFIRIALGVKWLPILDTFRLMLVFTLLDPVKQTVAMALTACGVPQKVVLARAIQLVILIAGLFALGPRFGIKGVAIAVDLMMVGGMVVLFWQVREYVDFSLLKLFGPSVAALMGGVIGAQIAVSLLSLSESHLQTGVVKLIVYTLVYMAILAVLERDKVPVLLRVLEQRLTRTTYVGHRF